MITSARIVTPGQAMATIPMMRASTPIRINEVDVDLNAVGIALARTVFPLSTGSAGEERQQFGDELAGVLQVRDVAAVGHYHPGRAGNIVRGCGRQRAEVAEPGDP